MKLHKNPSIGSRSVPCARTDGRTEGHTNYMKLIVAFNYFMNAPLKSGSPLWNPE